MLQRPKIVVIGSLNVDHTLRVPHIPGPGETRTATAAFTCQGGKGANQALAAARAGGDVTLIGCVGEDDFGTRYIDHLRSEGIHTGAVMRAGPSTGCAFITVDHAGENSIVASPGSTAGHPCGNRVRDATHLAAGTPDFARSRAEIGPRLPVADHHGAKLRAAVALDRGHRRTLTAAFDRVQRLVAFAKGNFDVVQRDGFLAMRPFDHIRRRAEMHPVSQFANSPRAAMDHSFGA
jgi:hypothetical protein